MIGAIAQFERELMLERQREGIAKAKAEGKYKGRAPTARLRLARSGGCTVNTLAKTCLYMRPHLSGLIRCASLSPGSNGSFR
jgi:DNA invertase Pin-like site-specific DNA recombinase